MTRTLFLFAVFLAACPRAVQPEPMPPTEVLPDPEPPMPHPPDPDPNPR